MQCSDATAVRLFDAARWLACASAELRKSHCRTSRCSAAGNGHVKLPDRVPRMRCGAGNVYRHPYFVHVVALPVRVDAVRVEMLVARIVVCDLDMMNVNILAEIRMPA